MLTWILPFVFFTIITPTAQGSSRRSDDPNPLEAVVQQLSHDLQVLQANQETLKAKVANQETEIATLKAENQRRVAFSAYLPYSPSSIPASPNAIINFSSLITNAGNAYSTATGVFTCPFDGDYFFAVSIDVSVEYEAVSFRKNGAVVAYADKDYTVTTHLSASVVLSLKQGDVVTVNQDGYRGVLDTGKDCTLSGFLVK